LFWLLVFLLLHQAYTLIFNGGVPNIRTAPAIRKAIIELLRQDCAARGGVPYTVIDLGSGNGLFTRQIARNMPQARVIGIERSKQSVWWSNLLRRWAKLDNLEYETADFFSYDLSRADAVVMYLEIYLMENLGKKLHKELKPGTLVISNRFRLGDGWAPRETLKTRTLYFHQGETHVYRQP
jgi:precorrin-6B methylase 2